MSHYFSENPHHPLPSFVEFIKHKNTYSIRWKYLEVIALKCPDYPSREQKELVKKQMMDVLAGLDCSTCHEHAHEYVRSHPIDLRSRRTVVQWLWSFHNSVNARIGKPIIDFDTALHKMASLPSCPATQKQIEETESADKNEEDDEEDEEDEEAGSKKNKDRKEQVLSLFYKLLMFFFIVLLFYFFFRFGVNCGKKEQDKKSLTPPSSSVSF